MKITKGKPVKSLERERAATARADATRRELELRATASADLANAENLAIYEQLLHTPEQAEQLRSSLWCTTCLHTALAHQAFGTATRCCVCSCTRTRQQITRATEAAWKEHKNKTSTLGMLKMPGAGKSAYHAHNKRVLQSVRRMPSGNASAEFICECGHKARMHAAVIVKGMVISYACTGQRGSATGTIPCGCCRTLQEAVESGKADAEST